MNNSIEKIWKEGFLNEKSLVAPKINDLYNRKSIHLVAKVENMFRFNMHIIVITAIVFPVVYYFLDATWQGFAASILLFITAWYNKKQINNIKKLNQGLSSLDYLKSLDQWLKDVLEKSEKIARFSYPLYVVIAFSTVWSAWKKQGLDQKIQLRFSFLDTEYVNGLAIAVGFILVLLMFYFSKRIYKWEVRIMYGHVFKKLEETINEMEKLKE